MNENDTNQLVINNVDSALIERLKKSAAGNGVSPEDQAKNILEKELPPDRAAIKKKALARLTEIREKYATLQKTSCVDLIREDRNR